MMLQCGAGLRELGLVRGERVALFSENSSRWIVLDQGIMMAGCVPAVRGSTAPADELGYILGHSGATGLVVQDKEAMAKCLPLITKVRAWPVVHTHCTRCSRHVVLEMDGMLWGLLACGVKVAYHGHDCAHLWIKASVRHKTMSKGCVVAPRCIFCCSLRPQLPSSL